MTPVARARRARKPTTVRFAWMLEKMLELSNAANDNRFVDEGCPVDTVAAPAATIGLVYRSRGLEL